MIAYIQGNISFKSPAYIIVESGGMGYQINISLNTFSKIQSRESGDKIKLFTYLHVKTEMQTIAGFVLYGFAEEEEKNLFIHLISVSGVGTATAMLALSNFGIEQLQRAIATGDVTTIQSIKGIGPKTAQRIVLELKEKLAKNISASAMNIPVSAHNTLREEALSALATLGFAKPTAEKAIEKVLKSHPEGISVEELIKLSLKNL